ncbi:MAG: helix-turn-helix domain-containing protein [Bacteroidales bacterium]|jgi:AraC-like DNA-binding protein|nr:helix-turn-helix domain-containing protein [Bacteroidales bacterium]
MGKNKLEKFSMADVGNYKDPYCLKHFILSDSNFLLRKFSFDEPVIFNGIILGLCLKGKAKLKINFSEYNLKTNTILVIVPNQVITILDKSDDFFMECLFVSVDFIAGFPLPRKFDLLSNLGHWPCIELSSDAIEDLIEYHAMIVKQHNQVRQPYRVEIVKGLLYTMLMEMIGLYTLEEEIPRTPSSRGEELTEQFFKLLRTHYKQERNVTFYADKLCVTSKYLSSLIKEITGESILSWIHEAVIVESKMLLKTTDLTVLQISEELNFSNPSFFGKFFKEHTGMTPLEFREVY